MTDKKPKYNFVRLDKNAYAILKRTKARLRKGGRVASYSDVIRYIAGEEKEELPMKKVKIEGEWCELPNNVSTIILPNGRYEIKKKYGEWEAVLIDDKEAKDERQTKNKE